MPGKLRKSRSRNNNNNRPASRQSRKRKTPKGKGKARKTTRRRSKRGGMFGRKGPKSDSPEKKALDLFMTLIIFYCLVKKHNAINESKTYFKNLSNIKYVNTKNETVTIITTILGTWGEGWDIYNDESLAPGDLDTIINAMPMLDVVKTLQRILDVSHVEATYIEYDEMSSGVQRLQASGLRKPIKTELQNKLETCTNYYTLLRVAVNDALKIFKNEKFQQSTEMKALITELVGAEKARNLAQIYEALDNLMKKNYNKSKDFFSAINNDGLKEQICGIK